jgi:hypothetical protein
MVYASNCFNWSKEVWKLIIYIHMFFNYQVKFQVFKFCLTMRSPTHYKFYIDMHPPTDYFTLITSYFTYMYLLRNWMQKGDEKDVHGVATDVDRHGRWYITDILLIPALSINKTTHTTLARTHALTDISSKTLKLNHL